LDPDIEADRTIIDNKLRGKFEEARHKFIVEYVKTKYNEGY
jgi:hypothetical protein